MNNYREMIYKEAASRNFPALIEEAARQGASAAKKGKADQKLKIFITSFNLIFMIFFLD